MPREVKKRGRRAAAKRAEEEQNDVDLKVYENDEDYVTFDADGGVAGGQEEDDGYDHEVPYNPLDLKQMPFFGFLDDQESEYFKTAESTLAVDAFGSAEEKLGFISGLLDEARGKELKLVTNQICSKLMERLILLANDEQIRALFEVFAGYFVDLSRHKYSSHCVETLLVRGAALVEKEVLDPNFDGDSDESMEKRFLTLANDMKDYIQDLISNPYASHVIRVLLLILGGQTLPSPTSADGNSSVLRSKKSRTARRNIDIKDSEENDRAYQIPGAFHDALEGIVSGFSKRLQPTAARELAIGQVSSPVVQLLIDSEATTSEKRPLLNTIFADTEDRDSSEEAFVEHLLSDAVGSHFLQNVLQKASEAFVERLYRLYMSQRVQKLVRRDYAGFVVETCMLRLPEEDVHHIIDTAMGEIPYLVENNNLTMVRILLTRAAAANYKATEVANAVLKTFDTDTTDPKLLQKVLQLDDKNPYKPHEASSPGLHRCLVLQQLVEASPEVLATAFLGLNSGEVDVLKMAKHQSFSRLLEKCLRPSINTIERRKFLNKLNGQCVDLARDPFASHVMDRLWAFSYKMNNFREKIANELVADDDLKENTYGKAVWRNWSLDKFLRRKSDWWASLHATDDALAKEYEELGISLDAKSLATPGTKRFGRGGARVITRGGGVAPRGRGRGGFRGRGTRGGFGGDRGGFKRANGEGDEDRSRKKVRNE
ncbi:Nucleolar protein 9 [Yarrowia sp. B02]|nr:Nucleolar protein 9 [Yarrowia sp. B02]